MKVWILMEFSWLYIMCHMLGLICYFMRSYYRYHRLRCNDSGLHNLLLYVLDLMYLRGTVVISLSKMGRIQMIVRAFVLCVTLVAIVKVESWVLMRFGVSKGIDMVYGVLFVACGLNLVLDLILMLNFRSCHMQHLMLNILLGLLIFLLNKKCGIHMNSRVEKG